MRMRERLARVGALLAPGLLLATGCTPADRYGELTTKPAESALLKPAGTSPAENEPKKETPAATPGDYAWMEPNSALMEPQVPIVFVTEEGNPAEWNKLTQFWNQQALAKGPGQPAAFIGLAPLASGALALANQAGRIVKIKVPRGLPDPTKYLPGSNLPTVGKWELGKRLFFDDSYLSVSLRQSCATCHQPNKGFTDGIPFHSPRTAPLNNVAYNRFLFWDGRANALEEVIQRRLEDESAPANPDERPHSWSGVIGRLRKNPEYNRLFLKVFGTPPTQDAVGKALATYLRTILTGDSVYDRAESARNKRKAQEVSDADFMEALKDAKDDSIKALDGEPSKKGDLTKQLARGAKLFHDSGCIVCHPGPLFQDDSFHNLGIGDSAGSGVPGREPGRFAALPAGKKDPQLIGAVKTPTLRDLPQTGPYFHNGTEPELFQAVAAHVKVHAGQVSPHLDPLLRDEKDPSKGRDLHLKEDDVRALVSFLKALDGAADPVAKERDNWPEGTTKPPRP